MKLRHGVPILLVLLLGMNASAQSPGTGAIAGTIFDQAHRVIVSAKVTALEDATHFERTAITDAQGDFRVPLLPPGNYASRFQRMDFRPAHSFRSW